MRKLGWVAIMLLLATGQAAAVSVWELSRTCGDDAKVFCDGVGYGDAMQQCLESHYADLSAGCQKIVDRIRGGEGVSLF